MSQGLHAIIPFAVAAVAVVLFLGLANLVRGGHPARSQLLMRWRIGLQFAALCLIMAALLWRAR